MHDLPAIGRSIDLSNLPWGAAHVILCSLRNPLCSPDMVLVIADALREMDAHLDNTSPYRAPIRRTEGALRDLAPFYALPPGKPLGDFDGSLTPE